MNGSHRVPVCALLLLLLAAGTSHAQAPPTVWHFLGIPQGWSRMRDASLNRTGKRPNRERKPPLKALADPANLKSDVPAIKAAAEIKAQQDLAPQKIKAIKYLAAIGCGCYGGVAEALQAALEDCVEEVRFAAAEALETAMGDHCEFCQTTCCTPELAEKMYERAYGRDADGCYIEPSERVRGVLARVVSLCPPDMGKDFVDPGTGPEIDVGPRPALPPPLIDGQPGTLNVPSRNGLQIDPLVPGLLHYDALPGDSSTGSSRRGQQEPTPAARNTQADFQRFTPPAAPPVATVPIGVCGEVVDTRSTRGLVRIVFHDNRRPPVGTEVDVYHNYVLGTEMAGTLVIRDWEGHHAIAAPRGFDDVKIARGDHVECSMLVPAENAPPPQPQPEVRPASVRTPTPVAAVPAVKTAATKAVPSVQAVPITRPAVAAKPAAIVTPAAAEPTSDTATAVQAALAKASAKASATTEAATNAMQRVFTLGPSDGGQSTAKAPATSTFRAASSKAVPTSRPAAAAVSKAPAPVVKPPAAVQTARTFVPAPAPITKPVAPVVKSQRPAASNALSEMLRLPAEQTAAPRTQSPAPVTAAPIIRPAARVIPASASLPVEPTSGTERLPPVVTPSQVR